MQLSICNNDYNPVIRVSYWRYLFLIKEHLDIFQKKFENFFSNTYTFIEGKVFLIHDLTDRVSFW